MKNLSKITKYKLALLLPIVLFCGTLLFCSCTKPEPAAPQFHRHLSELITYVSDCVGEFPVLPDRSHSEQLEYRLEYKNICAGQPESVTYADQFGGVAKTHVIDLPTGDDSTLQRVSIWKAKEGPIYLHTGNDLVIQAQPDELPELQLPEYHPAKVPNISAVVQDFISVFSGMLTEERITSATGVYDVPGTNGAKSTRTTLTLNAEDLTALIHILNTSAVENGLSVLCDTNLFALLERSTQLTWSFYSVTEQAVYTQLILTDQYNAELVRLGLNTHRKDSSFQWSLTGTVDARQFICSNEQTNTPYGKNGILTFTYRDSSAQTEAEGKLLYTTTLPSGTAETKSTLVLSVTENGQRSEYSGPIYLNYFLMPAEGNEKKDQVLFHFQYSPQNHAGDPYINLNLQVFSYDEAPTSAPFTQDRTVLKLSELEPHSEDSFSISIPLYHLYPEWMKTYNPELASHFAVWDQLPGNNNSAIQLSEPGTETPRMILTGKGYGVATFIRDYNYTDENGIVTIDLGEGKIMVFIYDPEKKNQIVNIGGHAFNMVRNPDSGFQLTGQHAALSGFLGSQLHIEFSTTYLIRDNEVRIWDLTNNTVSYPISVSNDRITIGDTSYTWNVSQP